MIVFPLAPKCFLTNGDCFSVYSAYILLALLVFSFSITLLAFLLVSMLFCSHCSVFSLHCLLFFLHHACWLDSLQNAEFTFCLFAGLTCFLVAPSHLYTRVCPSIHSSVHPSASVHPSVCLSVHASVCPSFHRSVMPSQKRVPGASDNQYWPWCRYSTILPSVGCLSSCAFTFPRGFHLAAPAQSHTTNFALIFHLDNWSYKKSVLETMASREVGFFCTVFRKQKFNHP